MLSGKDIGFEERQRLRNLQVKPKISIPETPEEQLRKHVWIYIDEMKQDNEESGMFENNSSEFNPENIFNNMMKRFKGTKALFHLNNIGVSLQQLKPDDDKWLVIDHLIERAVKSTVGDNYTVQTHQDQQKNPGGLHKNQFFTLNPS
ncbi:MAG: hypothetical protein EZS28_040623 [Streblomastix strix]|uniref:Uncharacterized protein n=1 Tax=Streblomastix strix TaxID=222440 RepID=A0A5J4U1J3_9EUKA|nr:MAG: hypothetical protein EZS28_040623 [Streblomastix strix]